MRRKVAYELFNSIFSMSNFITHNLMVAVRSFYTKV